MAVKRVCLAVLAAASCGGPKLERAQVLIGATLLNSGGRAAVERSVIVVEDGRFKAVGDQPTLPIPAGTEKVDLTGRFLIPAPVEAPKEPGWTKFSTQAEFRKLVGAGAVAVQGMVVDTEALDGDLLKVAREKGMIVVPKLMLFENSPLQRNVARRNLKAFADAGVPLAIDGTLAAHREWKLFAEAGVPAAQIIDGTTRLMARASKRGESGEIVAGYEADLYVLRCNPLQDLNCLTRVERAMENGRWVAAPARGEN